ncbi:hypothetical protein HA47_04205 [Pantoea stewartii subsp. indologenes]|uniref:AAA family ATPase n=1 Tax=Pantoea stewartii TaxID=66269 RepID=UPI0005100A80|nr:AAA family ATPase [Pantoea stewartii]KGD84848.1 hypothetical protein HA47_04205 [Pantoea stewartii subsp. indologenes]
MLINNFCDKIDHSIEEKKNFVYYLIGNNGTGKSRILNTLSNSVVEKPHVTKSICISNTLYDKFKPLDKKEIYLGLRTVNNAIFFSAVEKTICDLLLKCMKNKTLHLLEEDLGIAFSIKLTKNEKKHQITTYFDNRKLKNNYLSNFLKEGDENEIMSIAGQIIKFDKLTENQQNAINNFLTLNPNNLNLISSKKGVKFTFEQLSSGEQNRILLSAKILSYICNDSVILIDEPEVSLHLHWQVEFHKSLDSFIKKFEGVTVIIATHSPVIVSEGYKYDHSAAIIILESENNISDEATQFIEIRDKSSKNFGYRL